MRKIKIGIIGGKGTMGRLFKNFFERQGYEVLISGIKTVLTNVELTKRCNIVIFSVPIEKTPSVIKEVLPFTRKEQLLMDLTSIKEVPIKEMLKSNASVIGLHPMFGPVKSMKGQTIIVVPAKTEKKWLKWLLNVLRKNKIKTVISDAKKHDERMAILQGLLHASLITTGMALKKAAGKISLKELLKYGGAIYRIRLGMIARLLAQDPKLYADIALSNKNVSQVVDVYANAIEKFREIIKNKNKKGFIKYFKEASKYFEGFGKKAMEESTFLIEKLAEKTKNE